MRCVVAIGSILMSAAAIAAHGSNAEESLPLQPARQISIDTDEGTWLSPDISPDGGTLVFELLGDLFTVDTRGGSAHALTTGMAFDSQPVFSPTVMTSPSSVTGPAPRTSGSSGPTARVPGN